MTALSRLRQAHAHFGLSGVWLTLLAAVFALSGVACKPRDSSKPAGDGGAGGSGEGWSFAPVPETNSGKKKDEWNVDDPPGPKKAVKIDVDEGTWMSLDVSPDGKTIAFDLLGDLYTLPIAGGEARSLTHGIAWDMQPRFSPDGKLIAFTSDRDGADNIWVLPLDGGEARQITREDFRLLNSPAWAPDGQFIAARKHFTKTRSLGSGEVWLYHISGGKGVRMTKKPNDQKDVGEPVFSPDGRYLYFSRDATSGDYFEYNKNPHAGIYDIRRLDRQEGRIETIVGGPGGAARPTPSPDGASLAYVRRVGLRTALFVMDLKSGAERGVYYDLDRDMQETWAIHGVYPTMAWTPDSRSIVFWAGGKLHRVDAFSTKVQEIPFHVSDERTVVDAVRFPHEVHPDTFHTKMLRWVSVSPDGKSVVFQALGHLYVRDLPTGKPRRLTADNDVFEFYPSWSRDSKSIVYTTWSDEDLGRVVVTRRRGRPKTIVSEPGHYIEPTFSPDGQTIVYRKIEGGGVTSPLYSADPGLYAVPARGGEPRLVRRGGKQPHFGADSERVFFYDSEPGKEGTKYQLRSIELTGAKERTHVETKRGQEFRVSPDGKWLALREQFQAFVVPFPDVGMAFELGPKAKDLPVTRVSDDAGEYLHWSGDSRRLHWSMGPQLFERNLDEALAYIEGGPAAKAKAKEAASNKDARAKTDDRDDKDDDKDELPPARMLDIGFDVESAKPKGRIALTGARIVTMKGDEVIERGTVVIDGDRIAALGAQGEIEVPADAKTFDVSGTTIIPGLVDVHAHGSQGHYGITPQQNWLHYATLTFGVTTVHDPSNDTGEIFAAAEMARAGEITAPRIFSTGTILYGAEGTFKAVVDNLDDAREHLTRMKAVGAISVKSYNQPRRNQRQQVLAAARELEMMVVPEGGSTLQHNLNMVVDGHTGIEHAIPLGAGYADLVALWSGTEVGYTPTIGVGYGGLWGENYWYAFTEVFDNARLKAFVPAWEYEGRARRRTLASEGDWNHIRIAQLCKQLLDAGVDIQLGAHGQREGLAAHWELWMFVQGGMTPHEALRAGTLLGAHYVGLDGDIGSLEPGKLADLVVIEGNPLKNIRVSERVRYTMLGGRLFDAATMDELAGEQAKRAPFFWEGPGGATRPHTTASVGAHDH
jgi:Tol biopolymer transport system component/imidazolonepropionase-like amidohydrolase